VVDGSGLENRHTRKGIGGSNPSLSAITLILAICDCEANSTNTVKLDIIEVFIVSSGPASAIPGSGSPTVSSQFFRKCLALGKLPKKQLG
jgi:hypothetical protein